jgi:putative ABC transport system ATP-binding protein
MLLYSWQLTIPVVLLVVPLLAVVLRMQTALSAAYDLVRTRVGEMLSEVSESVMGAGVVRAYGLEEQTDIRVKHSIDQRYRAQVHAHLRAATMFPMAVVFWAVALSVVVLVGASFGPEWGLTFGQTAAFLFLADLFLHPFVDLPEIYAQTQTAISGWRKVLAVLDLPIEIVEPSPGVELPQGATSVVAYGVSYAYRGVEPSSGTSTPRSRREPTSRSSARRGAARRRSPSSWPGSRIRARAGSWWVGRISARSLPPPAAR